MGIELKIETKGPDILGNLSLAGDNPSSLLVAIALYHLRQINKTFSLQGARDDHETWAPFAIQYTRKTDGAVIPAWGGVPKLYSRGSVKGRKRPSGQRVTESSKIELDTGTLRASNEIKTISQNSLDYGSTLSYAGTQQALRAFLFFTEEDRRKINSICNNWIHDSILKVG